MRYAVFIRRYTEDGDKDSQFTRWYENKGEVEAMGERIHWRVVRMDTDIGSVVVLDENRNQVWEMEV